MRYFNVTVCALLLLSWSWVHSLLLQPLARCSPCQTVTIRYCRHLMSLTRVTTLIRFVCVAHTFTAIHSVGCPLAHATYFETTKNDTRAPHIANLSACHCGNLPIRWTVLWTVIQKFLARSPNLSKCGDVLSHISWA